MSMRTLLPILATLAISLLAALPARGEQSPSGPSVGSDLPGAFQSLNVTGEWAGRFHCSVCETGLHPGILVFSRQVEEPGKPLVELLKGINGLVEAFPEARIGAAAVFLNDGIYLELLQTKIDDMAKVADLPLTKAILFKEARFAQLAGLANEAKLGHVTLSLASEEGPKKYQIGKDAELTVIVYYKLHVLVNRSYAKDQFTSEEASKLLKEIQAAVAQVAPLAPARR
jgi:hypothetical protein